MSTRTTRTQKLEVRLTPEAKQRLQIERLARGHTVEGVDRGRAALNRSPARVALADLGPMPRDPLPAWPTMP